MMTGRLVAARFATTGADNRSYKRDKDGKFSSGGGMSSDDFDSAAAKAVTGQDALTTASLKTEPAEPQLAAINRYGGDGSYVVNADLRTQSGSADGLTSKNRTTVERLDSVMESSPLTHDVIVHRHIGTGTRTFGREVDSTVGDLTGMSWRDHAYTSTSVEDRGTGSHRIRLRILAPAGTPAFSHSRLDSDEILLGRGLKFTVVKDHGPGVVRHLDVVVES